MAQPFPGWVLDPARNQYYYFSVEEQCYIYQSGERIQLNTPAQPAQPAVSPDQPRHVPAVSSSRSSGRRDKGRERHDRQEREQVDEEGHDLAENFSGLTVTPGTDSNYTYGPEYNTNAYILTGPPAEITDPYLAGLGLAARGKLRGAPRDQDSLYPDYKRRRDGADYFVGGKVFKALWPELLGQANESVTVTSETRFGEQIATKIRWFIVVKAGLNHCTCLPIVTYNRQGVAKRGVVKRYHAIAYTSSNEPAPEKNEKPARGEGDPMLPGIRVVPKNRRHKLDKMSRVDFSRMYTVEHNVKVFDFGNVHPSHLGRLQSQWIKTITDGGGAATHGRLSDMDRGPNVGGGGGGGSHDDDAEHDDPDDEEEEEEEEEQGGERPQERSGNYRPDSGSNYRHYYR